MPVVPRRAAGRRVADDQGQGNSDDEAREVVSVEAPEAAPTRQQPSPEAGPSQQIADLSSLMEAFAKSQAEANRQLIETLLSTSIAHARSPTPATADGFASTSLGGANSHGGGNFSKCTARFDGEKKDVEVLEAFIDAVQVYKDCAGVSDEHALRGLPILLAGDAAVWWQGIKRSVRDWDDAINHLRAMYGSIKPAYKVFREMFAEEHTVPQRSEVFACKLRALMSTLPYELCEEAKVDIVYGLLDRKIRKRLPRELLNSLDDTICKLRHVEESMAEVKVPKPPVSKPKHFTKSDATDTTTSSNPTQQTPTSSNTPTGLGINRQTGNNNNKGLFCYGCGQQGVIRSKCNKCTQVDKKAPTKSSSSFNSIELKSVNVSHYGSSLPTRDRDCESRYYYYHDDEQTFTEQYSAKSVECLHFDKPDYSGKSPYSGKQPYSVENCNSVGASNIGFDRSIDRVYFEHFDCLNDMSCVNYSTLEGQQYPEDNANIQRANIDPDPTWPLVSIGIGGREGTAFIDTGASHCLASPSLYRVLLDAGTVFLEYQRVISLADGTSTARTILTGKCNVTLQGRDVLTTFLVIPGADTRTLLGRDFITDAGVVLNLPQWSWSFADDPKNNYDFVRSYSCVSPTDADALCIEASQLHLREDEVDCDLCQAVIDVPARDVRGYREIQLRDPDVRKILEDLEASDEPFRGRPWADRGYVISDGVLYRYGPEQSENDDACLVVPLSERDKVLAEYHDAPTAGHLGTERTLQRIASRYYWPGMRAFVAKYIKECVPCQRYKVDTRKPAGLIQSPAVAQRFEVIAVDLFGPLPETESGNKWILIIEDVCSRWVELFPLKSATSFDCAEVMVNEVFLRYGVPRRMISDNGVQFISEIMQQVCFVFGVDQALTPYYHPEANPVERKNRDLKPQLAIHVGKDHSTWDSHLAAVRFAMNSAVTHSTGYSPAMLTFGRELRAPADVVNDMRAIVDGDRFVANVTPYLKRLATILLDARDVHEKAQDTQKKYADEHRRPAPDYEIGDMVLLKTQGLNDAGRGQTPKFIPRRDGPYRIRDVLSSTTYSLERVNGDILGKYHASQLTPFIGKVQPPLQEKRKRGRPRKH